MGRALILLLLLLLLLLLWNSLPVDVQSALSLTTFRQKLKTHLLRQSYPDIVF